MRLTGGLLPCRALAGPAGNPTIRSLSLSPACDRAVLRHRAIAVRDDQERRRDAARAPVAWEGSSWPRRRYYGCSPAIPILRANMGGALAFRGMKLLLEGAGDVRRPA